MERCGNSKGTKKKCGGEWFGGRGPGRDIETEYISQYSEKK